MKKTKMLTKGCIMKKTKMLQGSIMKKKSDKRQNYDENKDTKNKYFKKYYKQKKTKTILQQKVLLGDKCKDELAQNNNCSMISTKKIIYNEEIEMWQHFFY